jgi:predicted tellurium resistance membrane protein TerC
MFSIFLSAENWLSLITLTLMEIVLGIDNVIFISLVTNRLNPKQQNSARRLGIFLALFIRLILLAFISYIVNEMTFALFTVADHPVSWRDIILMAGGLFLIYKSTIEIFEMMEPDHDKDNKRPPASFWKVVSQVVIIDIVFSFDSIITAVGLAKFLPIMITAVVLSMVVMLFFAQAIAKFIDIHPGIKLLALAFLLLIGVLLGAEAMGHHVPKGYVYFAMAFSVGVELLNMRVKRKSTK